MLATYLVAISAILFAGASALTWIYTVKHFDADAAPPSPERVAFDSREGVLANDAVRV